MFWKSLISDKEWRAEKWVTIALLLSFMLIGGFYFYSQKLIRISLEADQHLIEAIQDFRQDEDLTVLRDIIQEEDNHNLHRIFINKMAFVLGIALLIFALVYLIKSLRMRMRLQENLVSTKKQLEQSLQIKEQFLANMSHEIRTPLQTILGYTNRLSKEKLHPSQRQQITAIQGAGENLLTIVNDILDISKIESGMMRLEKVPFSISGLMHSLESMFQPKVLEKDIYFTLHVNPKIPDVLIGDPIRLTQILVNLINNAIKFTNHGGIDIFQKIIQKEQEKVLLRVSVQDTGIGIEKDKLETIFKRFEQVDTRLTRIYGGSGLGLYLVKELVDLQGGKVLVESQPGKGSIFSIEIPYIIGTDETIPKSADSDFVKLKENFHGIHLLLVEDNLMNQRVVGMFLSDWGINFDIADNGKTAIQLLEKNTYDLILMDVQMPEMDGYSATEYIRENMMIEIPIIAMTAHAMAGEREKAISYGMNEYISKPVKEADLYNIISRFVPLINSYHSTSNISASASLSGQASTQELYIDYNFLLGSSKGKRKQLEEILELFLRQAPKELASIDRAMQQQDFEEMARVAHSMKSTVAYVGMDGAFRPVLEAIEQRAKEAPEVKQLAMLYHQLKQLTRNAIQKIKTEAMPLVQK